MANICGYEFEIWNEDAAILFTCTNRVGCDGNPHRVIVSDGDSTATALFICASETRAAVTRRAR